MLSPLTSILKFLKQPKQKKVNCEISVLHQKYAKNQLGRMGCECRIIKCCSILDEIIIIISYAEAHQILLLLQCCPSVQGPQRRQEFELAHRCCLWLEGYMSMHQGLGVLFVEGIPDYQQLRKETLSLIPKVADLPEATLKKYRTTR